MGASREESVFKKVNFSEGLLATLGTSLDNLDESDLLVSDWVRVHLVAAKTARTSQDFKLVLEELAKALFFAFEDAYSIWPDFREIPIGWNVTETRGTRQECLRWIDKNWTDLLPKSLVEKMQGHRAHVPERVRNNNKHVGVGLQLVSDQQSIMKMLRNDPRLI